jgi:peptidylprolyl isomerase
MLFKRLATSLALSAAIMAGSAAIAAADENEMIITLKDGEVTVQLRPDLAPRHVAQIQELVRSGAYDNVAFHRVIEGFMAQTGDVQHGNMANGYNSQLAGTGASQLGNIPAEFSDVAFERGIVGMARAQDPNSANSQFFIMFAPAPSLNNQYTVVGEVTSGMEFVDNIKRGNSAQNGMVVDPDRMVSVRLGE